MYSLPFAIFLMYQTTSSFQENTAFDMNKIVVSDAFVPKNKGFIIKDELTRNLERLNDIAELESDWNGYGTESFSSELITEVRNIISSLSEQPEIFPTGRKSIQLEYHLSDKSYLEFEIFGGKVIAMQVSGTDYDNAKFWELSASDISQIQQIVYRFVNAQ